jgi:hypothetical protein
MLNAPRLFSRDQTLVCRLLPVLLLCFAGAIAHAQVAPVTELDRQLARVDLAIIGSGMFNSTTTGTIFPNAQPPQKQTLIQRPSDTFGAVASLRYIKSPLIGFEANYSYSRFAEKYNTIGFVQTRANEYSFGYVAHLPTIFGVTPFASVGAGSTGFTPTAGGGQGIPAQARATYYYNIGIEQSLLSKHFGLRAQFREAFFKSPDFGQNYLTIQQRTHTYEPGIGFFLRF